MRSLKIYIAKYDEVFGGIVINDALLCSDNVFLSVYGRLPIVKVFLPRDDHVSIVMSRHNLVPQNLIPYSSHKTIYMFCYKYLQWTINNRKTVRYTVDKITISC